MNAFEIFNNTKVKNEFSLAFKKLDRMEVIQLLSDLKYLPLKAFEDNIVESSEMAKAIQRFRLDYHEALQKKEMSNLSQIKLVSEIIEHEEALPFQLTHRELHVLKEITGLDNELVINQVEKNKATLFSRVLIYRYRIYDLVSTILPNHKLTPSVISKLEKSATTIGYYKGWLLFGNLLANQEELSSFCINSPVLSNTVFGDSVFIKIKSKEGRNVIRELGRDIKTKRRFQNSIVSNGAKSIISRITNHNDLKEVSNEVNLYMQQTANIFMRRVLQVKLWMMGLYHGRLDHYFGPLSIKALSDYLMTIVENSNTGKKQLGKILYNLRNDQCIININYLLTTHFIPIEKTNVPVEHSSVSQIFDFVLEDKKEVSSFKRSAKKEVKQDSEKLKITLEKELQKESKAIINEKQKKVRHYKARKGIMKFFSKLFKFVKNVITKIRKLFEKLFRLIKKTIKIIYNEIREAFLNFSKGLKFLFSNRIISPTPFITTDYDFDFDGITKIHSKPSPEDIKIHATTIKQYASAVYPTLNFIRIVIKWGISIASGPIGWVKILVGIAKLFKETLRKKVIEKPIPFNGFSIT